MIKIVCLLWSWFRKCSQHFAGVISEWWNFRRLISRSYSWGPKAEKKISCIPINKSAGPALESLPTLAGHPLLSCIKEDLTIGERDFFFLSDYWGLVPPLKLEDTFSPNSSSKCLCFRKPSESWACVPEYKGQKDS